MLQAKDIHFCIKSRPIVDRADVTIQPETFTVVIGQNGAGKSTLFRILSGELACKHGVVKYNGISLQQLKPKQLATIRAVMPQHSTLTFPFRAMEVVELGLCISNKKYPPNTIEEVMKATHTWEFREQLYGNLSGGEKQRVQLARVLAQIWEVQSFPRYLLLDEPTSSMDIAQQHHILQIISQLKKRNIGILAILHDLNLAANYADRIIMLKNGAILHNGPVREVMTSENLHNLLDYPVQVDMDGPDGHLLIHSLPISQNKSNFKIKLA